MFAGAPDLPAAEAAPAVGDALADNRPTVLVAPPGAGKTTLIPLTLLDADWLGNNRIVMLEPRRLATRAAATRMAELLGEPVGQTVGYQTRDERKLGSTTRIEVVTEGILTRRLQNDPELPGTGLVIFDEVHERNLPTDLGLALTLDARSTIRNDLRLLTMSATPDVTGLMNILGSSETEPALVTSHGRMFDVEMRWLPRKPKTPIDQAAAAAVGRALTEEHGDVLVFLPGIGEIRRTQQLVEQRVGPDVDVYPLAGALGQAEQDRALAPSPAGRRRVVLSTDIAETSLTVDGVRIVIDSGLAREPRFDVGSGMTRLVTVSTSRSSADQRAGRAGRTEPGTCYRLFSKIEYGTRAPHRVPEIESADLAGLALELVAWGTPASELSFITAPPASAMKAAHQLLAELGALDGVSPHEQGAITEVGRKMLGLPVHPRLARMLCAEPSPLGCAIAVLLEERDIFRGSPNALPAALELRLGVLAGHLHDDRADRGAVHRARDRANDLARRLNIGFDRHLIDPDRSGGALLWAYPDRLAKRRRPGQFQLRSGGSAWVPSDDPLAHEDFLIAADTDGKKKNARIRLGAGLDGDDVAAALDDEVVEKVRLEWDHERDDLVEVVERRVDSMQLGKIVRPPAPSDHTTTALMERVRATGLAVLGWSAASVSLRERVAYLHEAVGEPWPDWSATHLVDTVDEWLAPYLPGATRRADLEGLDVATVLRSQLPWPEGAEVDNLAPPTLELPTGREVGIDYSSGTPTARVRVQDLFGVTVHPTAGGAPIVLELLSPADRPIQITSDLPGFWSGSWTDVKKDLAGRYPKHQWPDDPATATPRRLKGRDQ